MFAYLLYALPVLSDHLQKLVDVVAQAADRPFAETWGRAVNAAVGIIMLTSLPLVAVIVVTDLVSGMAATFGLVFSFDTIKPRFDHINPAQGLKRIVSLRNVVEFAKAAAKVVVLVTAFWLVLRGAIQPLFEVPTCGETCLAPTALATFRPLAATAMVA